MSGDSPIILPLNDFAERVSREAIPVIEAATVPLLSFKTEKPKINRTAVFIQIDGEHFLLTCAHGLEKLLHDGIPLVISLGYREEPFALLQDEVFLGTESSVRDVTAIHLASQTVMQLTEASKAPIKVEHVLRGEPKPGSFLIFGHPHEWFSFGPGELKHPPLPFLATMVQPSDELVADLEKDEVYGMPYRPELHGLFTMSSQGVRVRDGMQVPLPNYEGMQGISGCGIWRLCDDNYPAMREWRISDCRLAAIEHRYDASNKFVHASWIGLALGRIVDQFPHLAKAVLGSS